MTLVCDDSGDKQMNITVSLNLKNLKHCGKSFTSKKLTKKIFMRDRVH